MKTRSTTKSGKQFKRSFRDHLEATKEMAAEQILDRAKSVSSARHLSRASGNCRQAERLGQLKTRLVRRTLELVPDRVVVAVYDDHYVGLLSIRWRSHGWLYLPASTQLPNKRAPHGAVGARS